MYDLNFLLFGIYPYVVAAVFFIGCWVRYDREPYTWKADSSQLLGKKKFRENENTLFSRAPAVFASLRKTPANVRPCGPRRLESHMRATGRMQPV